MNEVSAPDEQGLTTKLRGVAMGEYGVAYREHLLEIYKIYLEMADRISGRREKANAFFLTVNTALIAVFSKNSYFDNTTGLGFPRLLVPLVGGVLCFLWYRIIRSYRDLNSAKFKVIHAIEIELPLRPYDAEWESVGRGKKPQLYLPITHVEGIVPWLFMLFHAILAASYMQ